MDYVSLIKTIQYDANCFGPTSALTLRLEIPLRRLPLYHSRIKDLLSIRTLRIMTLDIPHELIYHWTPSQKETVECDLKIASSFVSEWSAAYSKLPQESRTHPVDIQFSQLPARNLWWELEPFPSQLKAIFLQMPVSPIRDLSTLYSAEWVRFALAPESIDLARLRSIVDFIGNDFSDGSRYWYDQHKAKIFQQCRSLQKLDLRCFAIEDDTIFHWAVQERQRAAAVTTTSLSNSGGTKPLEQRCGGVVPLSELSLHLSAVTPSWKDAVFAFGATLQSLTIKGVTSEVDLCVFCDMPVLRYLHLSFRLMKAGIASFSGCPRLTEIHLHSASRMDNDQDRFEQWDLAKVHVLSLMGEVCHQFNQATLKDMPMLENLIMYDDLYGRFGNHGGPYTWDRLSWGPFPRLTTLKLSGAMAKSFCWSMLEQCPAMDNLSLNAKDIHATEEVELILFRQQAGFAFERPTSPLAVYPTLRTLTLRGYSISDAVLFDQLPRVAPNFTSLTLRSRTRFSSEQHRKLYNLFKFLDEITSY
ncbi:hypothetical protein DFQ27_001078 [Actinomortierella ambigua]|uniref:Uncharacterized protein n=1 Tax=Actinomortierella ambigua TaxID=1343610 RepID=A0A9P6U8X8_9FUNG|nr:hypothetical protein DFQ27_001078 [Actinomortierella ambigua]